MKAAVLATVAAVVSLLLAAPARAAEPIGGTDVAQRTLDQARGALGDAAASTGEAPSAAPVRSGGGAAVSPEEPVPAGDAVVGQRPGAISEAEETLEPVVRSGQTAVRETATTLKRTHVDAEADVDAARGGRGAERRVAAGPSRSPRATSASAAPATRAAREVRSPSLASPSSSPLTAVRSRMQVAAVRLARTDAGAQARPAAVAAETDAAGPMQRTESGGGANASTGVGAAAAAILLAAWLLTGAALRTRVLSSPAVSPALGFSSLLERPG